MSTRPFHFATAVGLLLLQSQALQAQQREGRIPASKPPVSATSWQDLNVSNYPPDGLDATTGNGSFADSVAASYKDRSGMLFRRQDQYVVPHLNYNLTEGGTGYVYDPILTKDNVLFRFGKVENAIDGFNLLYIDNNDVTNFELNWVSPFNIYYERIEVSPSGRYVAYMSSGDASGANHVYHGDRMALWVTDIQAKKIAKVDTGDWITGTYWWDGENLRFLNLRKEPLPKSVSPKPNASQSNKTVKTTAETKAAAIPTRDVIEAKRFATATGTTLTIGRQPYEDKSSYLENYYNAFFGVSYSGKLPKKEAQASLLESMSYDGAKREILFASRTLDKAAEKASDPNQYTFAITKMKGKDSFERLGDFKVSSFKYKPEVKLFRSATRIFLSVKSFGSGPNTYPPDSDMFPSHTLAIYELKNGQVELLKQEEVSFGLSMFIDGISIYATY